MRVYFLVFVWLCFGYYTLKAQSSLDKSILKIIEQTEPSVVNVTFFDDYNEPIGYSTGFFVSGNTVVAAGHLSERATKITVTTFQNESYDVLTQIAEIPQYDLSLFKIGGFYDGSALTIADEVTAGADGFMLATSPLDGFIFKVSNCTTQETNIVINGTLFSSFSTKEQFVESDGMPIVNASGQLIGIVNSNLALKLANRNDLALDVKYLSKLLDMEKNNPTSVSFGQSDVKPKPPVIATQPTIRDQEDDNEDDEPEPVKVQPPARTQPPAGNSGTTAKEVKPAKTESPPKPVSNPNLGKTSASELEIDRASFEKKAMGKVTDFQNYIKVITNKQSHFQDVNKSIDMACSLFINEDVLVDVSNKQKQSLNSYPIRSYLNRLKQLKYDKIEMEWVNIYYLSNLRKGVDGNYYGVISFDQVFKGIKDGKVVFGDVTRKTIEVIAKVTDKQVGGEIKKSWDVFLGDIRVVETW